MITLLGSLSQKHCSSKGHSVINVFCTSSHTCSAAAPQHRQRARGEGHLGLYEPQVITVLLGQKAQPLLFTYYPLYMLAPDGDRSLHVGVYLTVVGLLARTLEGVCIALSWPQSS